MNQYRIAVIVGSLRRDSINRQLADAVARLAPQQFKFKQVQIGDLALYNQDDETEPVAAVKHLKSEISSAQGVVFVTPEYNRSVPGVMKNAIDAASRPHGPECLGRKAGRYTQCIDRRDRRDRCRDGTGSTCEVFWLTWICPRWLSRKHSCR